MDLKIILELHSKWLRDEKGGKRAVLRGAVLRGAVLSCADLRDADLRGADLRGADLSCADLRDAVLSGAVLRGAVLSCADLRDADFDFSYGFSCKYFDMKIDIRLAAQIAYHFCRMKTDDEKVKQAQKDLKELANLFHRVDECGRIE